LYFWSVGIDILVRRDTSDRVNNPARSELLPCAAPAATVRLVAARRPALPFLFRTRSLLTGTSEIPSAKEWNERSVAKKGAGDEIQDRAWLENPNSGQ
jgi:hypothetical protein